MKTTLISQVLLSVLTLTFSLGLLASDQSSCATNQGRKVLVDEYVKGGGLVPSCGPDCAQDFILSQVCEFAVKPSCLTQAGRALKVEEYVRSGGPVPACGPACAQEFILSQVCPSKK